ncbi:MAG TPA: hypothetical protein VKG92_02395 [Flavobacteriales bacterium]|nr:hypothetical protein [Flavobacteriales bacterium]
MKPSIWKSIGAVVLGFLTAALLSVATDALMHGTGIFPPVGQVMSNGLFVLATGYRFAFQTLGGYVTARLAPAKPMKHVWILAGIGQVLSLLGILAWKAMGPAGGPLWYPLALVVTAIPSVWIGGWLQQPLARTTN